MIESRNLSPYLKPRTRTNFVVMHFTYLPADVLLDIIKFGNLAPSDVLHLGYTCKRLYTIAETRMIWIRFTRNKLYFDQRMHSLFQEGFIMTKCVFI